MAQSHKDIAAIVDMFEASGIEELVIELPELNLAMRRGDGGEVPEPDLGPLSLPLAAVPAPQTDRASEVRAPIIGTFLRSAKPNGPPLVAIGDTVAPGQPLGLIRVLKTDTAIEAPRAGRIADIAAADGALVEYDQILFVIAPA